MNFLVYFLIKKHLKYLRMLQTEPTKRPDAENMVTRMESLTPKQ